MTHRIHTLARALGWASLAALVCALQSPCGSARAQIPDAELPVIDAPVVDLAGVLSSGTMRTLEEQLRAHQSAHGVQLAVLVVETTMGEPIEDYALRVVMRWRGGSAARDDGALYVLAVRDRRQRLEVGYGLEDRIPDHRAEDILRQAVPHLRSENYEGAVSSVVGGVILSTGDMAPLPEEMPEPEGFSSAFATLPVHLAILVLATVVGSLQRKRARSLSTEEIALHLTNTANRTAVLWMALFTVVMGTAAGLLGFGWFHYLHAIVGLLAGWRFAWDHPFVTVHYLFMVSVFGTVFGMVGTDFSDETVIGQLVAFGAQLFVTTLYAGQSRRTHTSFTSNGVSDEDQAFYDQVRAPSVWHAPKRSPNAGHFGALGGSSSSSSGSSGSSWGSSSSGSSSSRSSSSSSRSSGYSGGGGGFGGGGASSSW